VIAPSVSSRTGRRQAQNREALVAAARRVFVRDGFERATIAAIAEEADLGFGTFYRYFPDKAAALAAVEEGVRQDIDAVLSAPDYDTGPAVDALTTFTRRFIEAVNRNKDVFLLLWRQLALQDARTRPAPEEFPERAGMTLARIVTRGIASGEFVAAEVETNARFLTGMHLSLIPGPPLDDGVGEALCAFELRALGAPG
jgi:AcrR family transcriptional regulator